MNDKTLLCAECGKEFVFTIAEQEFFKERGFDHDPKRCVPCRRKRRRKFQARQPRETTPGNRRHGPHEPHGPRASDPAAPTGPPPPPATMYTTVCSACGEETQVPFEPDGVRPVYCMPCLKQQTR